VAWAGRVSVHGGNLGTVLGDYNRGFVPYDSLETELRQHSEPTYNIAYATIQQPVEKGVDGKHSQAV